MHEHGLLEDTVSSTHNGAGVATEEVATANNALQSPVLFPRVFAVSGLYAWSVPAGTVKAEAVEETLRLDVDGSYPQMVASGTIRRAPFLSTQGVHWIANLTAKGSHSWSGTIWFTDLLGGTVGYPFPYTTVDITVTGGYAYSVTPPLATVTFGGGGAASRVRVFKNVSPWFRDVEFEFDGAAGTTAVTAIQTHAHPNRPATLPDYTMTAQTVFSRAGFDVMRSPRTSVVPLAGAGGDGRWSDSEMHDAMQTYWSRFDNSAQWSLWTFFASLHEQGANLGGVMFDDIGPNHRQGCAVFEDSFIGKAPAGDAAPAAWAQRMRFFAVIHEMGHCFNLAHSWQKSLTDAGRGPWIPLADEPEARSIMNYPQLVSGGQTAFFGNFEYRFSDAELLFLRHAPERFVEMGNADWFDHHGFAGANVSAEPKFGVGLHATGNKRTFEFMEPVVLEMRLSNISGEPQLIRDNLLSDRAELTVIVKKDNRPARQLLSYVQYCTLDGHRVIVPGDVIRDSLFVSAGRGGWLIDEPGFYTIQLALRVGDEDVVSNAFRLRVAPPRGYDEEWLAQELFSDEVGRILAFDGSRFFEHGNSCLREITERLSDRRIAVHARVALAMPMLRAQKQLVLPKGRHHSLMSAADIGGTVQVSRPRFEEAMRELTIALVDQAEIAADTLGDIDTRYYVDQLTENMCRHGHTGEAASVQTSLSVTLGDRDVSPEVSNGSTAIRDAYRRGE